MFSNLRAEMARYNIKPKDIAKALNVSGKTMGNKLNRKTDFTLSEMAKIRDTFFPHKTVDELFFSEEPKNVILRAV